MAGIAGSPDRGQHLFITRYLHEWAVLASPMEISLPYLRSLSLSVDGFEPRLPDDIHSLASPLIPVRTGSCGARGWEEEVEQMRRGCCGREGPALQYLL